MVEESFYYEEQDIIFESYSEEPELEMLHSIPEACVAPGGSFMESLMEEDSIPAPGGSGFFGCTVGAERFVTVDIERLRRAGVPEYIIDMILENEEELSSMRITRTGRIILPEYKIEVKMLPLDKALYFLYLRHPEGIRFKDLIDHRDELMDIYASISGRSDMDAIRESIEALTDPTGNSVNEKCSRIKRAFTKAFSEKLARHYFIDGKSGEPKSIALDRSKVVWETLRP